MNEIFGFNLIDPQTQLIAIFQISECGRNFANQSAKLIEWNLFLEKCFWNARRRDRWDWLRTLIKCLQLRVICLHTRLLNILIGRYKYLTDSRVSLAQGSKIKHGNILNLICLLRRIKLHSHVLSIKSRWKENFLTLNRVNRTAQMKCYEYLCCIIK